MDNGLLWNSLFQFYVAFCSHLVLWRCGVSAVWAPEAVWMVFRHAGR